MIKKRLFTAIFLGMCVCASAQIVNKQKIEKGLECIRFNGIDGMLFSKDVVIIPSIYGDTLVRSTPTRQDAILSERLLKKYLYDKAEDSYPCSYVSANYWNYVRQYCAFTNSKGEKYIIINALDREGVMQDEKDKKTFPKYPNPSWYQSWQQVLDGGTSYWQALVNITTKKVIWFSVNGVA